MNMIKDQIQKHPQIQIILKNNSDNNESNNNENRKDRQNMNKIQTIETIEKIIGLHNTKLVKLRRIE